MENMIKPSHYAKKHNLSKEEVYIQIKQGLLPFKTIEGQTYILEDAITEQKEPTTLLPVDIQNVTFVTPKPTITECEKLLEAKNETIEILKTALNSLKESNQQLLETIKEEFELLKITLDTMQQHDSFQKTITQQKQAKRLESWISTRNTEIL